MLNIHLECRIKYWRANFVNPFDYEMAHSSVEACNGLASGVVLATSSMHEELTMQNTGVAAYRI